MTKQNDSITITNAANGDSTNAPFTFYNIEVNLNEQLKASQDNVIKSLNNLIEQRKLWEENEYARSNEKLYEILTRCYEFFFTLKVNSNEAKLAKRAFDRVCDAKGYIFRESTHLMTKVVTAVFEQQNSSRVSKYATALRAAAEKNIKANDLADYFYINGGIEEIRASKNSNGLTRHQKGQAVLYGESLTRISDDKLLDEFKETDYEDAVLFLATYDCDNEDFIFYRIIQNKTAIKAAFMSLSSSVSSQELESMMKNIEKNKFTEAA